MPDSVRPAGRVGRWRHDTTPTAPAPQPDHPGRPPSPSPTGTPAPTRPTTASTGAVRAGCWPAWPPGWPTTSTSTPPWSGSGFVALALLGGLAVPLYLAGWLLIPEEGTDVSVAEELLARERAR